MRQIYRATFLLILLLSLVIAPVGQIVLAAGNDAAFEPIGPTGGSTLAIDINGNYAYVGVGSVIFVLNVLDPAHPVMVGKSSPLSGNIASIRIANGYAYVADFLDGFAIMSLASPTTPVKVSSLSIGWAVDVEISGNYAYIADTNSVKIIDVTDKANPIAIANYEPSNIHSNVKDIAIAGNYAYVAYGWDGGLRILDISTPATPLEVGTLTSIYAYGVDVSGNRAYVATEQGMSIVDISNPSSPSQIKFVDVGGYNAYIVSVSGNYAYVTDMIDGLHIVNVSNSNTASEVGTFSMSDGAENLILSGNYAFVAAGSGLRIINVGNASLPILTSTFVTNLSGSVSNLLVDGNYLYAINGSRLQTISRTDPANLLEMASYSLPSPGYIMKKSGNYMYVADGWSGLRILSISSPAHLIETGHLNFDVNLIAVDLDIDGQRAYIATSSFSTSLLTGIQIVDISNPALPSKIGFFHTAGNPSGISVVYPYAYIADGSDGWLRIINISNPLSPVEVGSVKTPGMALDVVIAAGDAYVADGYNGVQVVDITTPSSPTIIGSISTPEYTPNLDIYGKYVFASASFGGLRVIDVSSPASPKDAWSYDTPGFATGAVLGGNFIYIADNSGGIYTFWTSDQISATVPSQGGTLVSSFDLTTYNFPSNTFNELVTVTYTPLYSGGLLSLEGRFGTSYYFEVSAVNASGDPIQPDKAYSITIHFTQAEIGAAIESTLALYYWDDVSLQWVIEPTSIVDTNLDTIIATPTHFSNWAVLGNTNHVYIPTVLR